MRMNSGFSVGIVGMAPWLADLRLHLDCCVASPWPASRALLLFFLLMVITLHLQVRPTPPSALPFYVNAVFATSH
jgi:hypothetical protein